jgi:hypothetical protein
MRTYSLEKPGLWCGIEDWPHRQCVDAMVSSMQDQKYSAKCIYKAVQTAGRFVAWLGSQTAGADDLDYAAVERFVGHRAKTGELRNGERAALRRLRGALLEAGVIAPPPLADDGREHLLKQFEASLRRRGYRDKSIASHLWFCRPFVQDLWDETTGLAAIDARHHRSQCRVGRGLP